MPTMHQCLQILQALLHLYRQCSLVDSSKPESTSEWNLLRWLMLCVLLGTVCGTSEHVLSLYVCCVDVWCALRFAGGREWHLYRSVIV